MSEEQRAYETPGDPGFSENPCTAFDAFGYCVKYGGVQWSCRVMIQSHYGQASRRSREECYSAMYNKISRDDVKELSIELLAYLSVREITVCAPWDAVGEERPDWAPTNPVKMQHTINALQNALYATMEKVQVFHGHVLHLTLMPKYAALAFETKNRFATA